MFDDNHVDNGLLVAPPPDDGAVHEYTTPGLPLASLTTTIEAHGATSLVQVDNTFSLQPVGGSSGPLLSYGGATVTAGMFGGWTPIAAEANAGGFEVAWKLAGADQYTFWNVDSAGHYLSQGSGGSGISLAVESAETRLQQDLNGDGTTGPVTTTIEATGATKLVQIADRYYVGPSGGTAALELSAFGAPVVAGEFGPFVPIAAEATASGYQVAWKSTVADQYTVLNADSSGVFQSHAFFVVPGASLALEGSETTLQQDLNGDGTTGIVTTTIESSGVTALDHIANTYSLNPVGGGAGPQLKFAGAAVTDGEFGAWSPIAAEHVGDGYRVAWKLSGADLYQVWSVDGAGNYLSSGPAVSGGSYSLEATEALFQQNLNGDGATGLATTAIESSGLTALDHVANTYSLDPSGGGSGPQLKFGGAAITDGEFGTWSPIAAEHVGDGYRVAWKLAGADLYQVWSLDGGGNYLSSGAALVGGSYLLEASEALFQQDLNSDGTTGLVTTAVESAGATGLIHSADRYFLDPVGGGSGPQLNLSGTPYADGMFGAWTPIGAEHTADGGYEVALKFGSADRYTVWFTDANGSYRGDIGAVSGASYKLASREPSFGQDLNGDATIGPVTSVVESAGSTTLAHVSDTYFFYPSGGSSGPQLNLAGTAFTDGLFGAWTPIGAEHTADGGYQVALKFGSADQYTVWFTDANGTYRGDIGAVSGASYKLTSREASFGQDLNGIDGIGSPTSVVESFGALTLRQVADTYFLGTTGPQLNIAGVAFTVGQFGAWTPIGAEAIAGGYEVALKFGSADQYTVWFTNGNGTYVGDIGVVAGASYKLTSREASFAQDLNGINGIGSPVTVLETFGSIQLTQVADTYFLYAVGTSNGPQLNVRGEGVTTGEFGGWTPIAAEQTVYGYRVAWKLGLDQYTVWNTNANGAYAGDIGAVSGSSNALRSFEPAFSQDLNGDGSIASAVTIESVGATKLTQVLDTYFLNSASTGVWGPQVSFANAAATPSRFGGWTPIAGEASGINYLVAWKLGADQYSVWTVDGLGSYLLDRGVMSGSSTTLQSLEPAFGQDLNGDGTIGIDRFNITIRYTGNAAYQSYFDAAARRWEQVITAGLPNVNSPTYGFIDDLLIDASVVYIDGPGRILGQAGPNAFRTGSNLPTHGIMQFDSADISSMVSQGTFGDVVLHEMGHVLGLGTLWDTFGLKPTFTTYGGAGAVEAYRQLSGNPGAGTVPLESTGGSGTAGVHWSEAVFGNELMTGFISGAPNPLSIMTIGALRDLGYTVNYAAADPYTMPGHLMSASGSGGVSSDLSGLIAANADPGSAWYGLVDGLATEFTLSLVLHDEDDDDGPVHV